MRKTIMNCLSAGAGILALTMGAPAHAQGSGMNEIGKAYWLGRSLPPQPACPTVEWNVLPVQPGVAGAIKGVAFFSDMRGISTINGTIAADGTVAATLTSVSGNGPAGTVDGKQGNNLTSLTLHGIDCSNATFKMRRWGTTAGGGGG